MEIEHRNNRRLCPNCFPHLSQRSRFAIIADLGDHCAVEIKHDCIRSRCQESLDDLCFDLVRCPRRDQTSRDCAGCGQWDQLERVVSRDRVDHAADHTVRSRPRSQFVSAEVAIGLEILEIGRPGRESIRLMCEPGQRDSNRILRSSSSHELWVRLRGAPVGSSS